jgi:hypothetical protein
MPKTILSKVHHPFLNMRQDIPSKNTGASRQSIVSPTTQHVRRIIMRSHHTSFASVAASDDYFPSWFVIMHDISGTCRTGLWLGVCDSTLFGSCQERQPSSSLGAGHVSTLVFEHGLNAMDFCLRCALFCRSLQFS